MMMHPITLSSWSIGTPIRVRAPANVIVAMRNLSSCVASSMMSATW